MAKTNKTTVTEINETAKQTTENNTSVEVKTDVPAELTRVQMYVKIVEENRDKRNQTRSARYTAIKEMMEAGKSMPVIAAELNLTYRQVKHVAWYIQHPDVPMPTR